MLVPVAGGAFGDGDVGVEQLGVVVGGGLPVGAAGAFDEAEGGVEADSFEVVVADVEPGVVYFFVVGVLEGALGEGTGDAFAAVVGVDGDVGDEVEAGFVVAEGDEADVADDVSVVFPDVAGEGEGGGFGDAVCPFEEGVVGSGAAHVLYVAAAFAVHGVGEAEFDEVCDLGEVAEDVEGAQVGVVLFAGGDGDGCHRGYYSAVWGVGKGWGWLWGRWGSIGRALGERKGSLIIRLGDGGR